MAASEAARGWGGTRQRAIAEACLVVFGLYAFVHLGAVDDYGVLAAPVLLGLVAGFRAPGDLSDRVAAGLIAWLAIVLLSVHVVFLFYLLGEFGGGTLGVGLLATLAYLPLGLVVSGLAAFFGGAVAAALASGPIDVNASLGEAPSIREVELLRLAGSIVAGTIATAAITVPLLLTAGGLAVLVSPLMGGGLAGYLAPEGSGMGALAGLCSGLLSGIGLAYLFVRWVESLEYVGPGIAIVLVLVLFVGLLSVLLGGLGGLLGAQE